MVVLAVCLGLEMFGKANCQSNRQYKKNTYCQKSLDEICIQSYDGYGPMDDKYSTVQYCIVQYSTIQYYITLYSTVLYYTTQYKTALCSKILYGTVQY